VTTKILVLHGINLNMFGKRDASVYGTATLDDINQALGRLGAELGLEVQTFQTNHEGEMVVRIHAALDDGTRAIVINAGAWTHYSYGIRDALAILRCPIVEVHMSNLSVTTLFSQTWWQAKSVAWE
jgi:3-dehydroquinate dehydratase-2